MLGKLLKYEIKNMFKFLSFFYVLCIFFSITTRILFSFDDTTILYIMGQISVGCYFAMIANILINTIMRNFVRFNESMYRDEAYLTHTLPVTKRELYTSKFLISLITFIVSFIVIVISLFIAYYTRERWSMFISMLDSFGVYGIDTMMIIIILVLVFLELYSFIQVGFVGLILGNRKENNKIVHSVIYGFIIYLIIQGVILLGIFVFGLFNKSVMDLFITNSPNIDTIKIVSYTCICFYILITIVLKEYAIRKLEKGVNVV